jgi:oxygen-dependent protoporphyrinogen oxidase
VRLDCAVSSVSPGWRLDTSQGSVECDAVIIAAPAYAAARMLRDVDAEAARLCAQTGYVSTVSLALAWPREAVGHSLNGTGFVVARVSNALHLTACTWVTSKFEGRAPAGKILLRAYMGGAHDPVAVDRSDDELVGTAVGELSQILSITGPPELTRVYRWRNAGAQHDVAQAARVETLQRRLLQHRVLFVTGSGFKAVGVPDCIADGRRTAIAAMGQV